MARSNAVTVLRNGNVGIGQVAPATRLHLAGGNLLVEGFSRLGAAAEGAPNIKTKKITATGPAINGSIAINHGLTAAKILQVSVLMENGSIAINHGLTAAKILQVSVLMEYGLGAGETIPPNYTTAAGYQYDWQVRTNDIFIINRSGNSANIGNRPVRILITYEE
ncbi:MAG: hypothetical protein MUF62_00805 [Chitinophagaceae bacterium]|nr:hypothetical protein [Chitinophagaceae bacterium]